MRILTEIWGKERKENDGLAMAGQLKDGRGRPKQKFL
jgi:hypothetical protein